MKQSGSLDLKAAASSVIAPIPEGRSMETLSKCGRSGMHMIQSIVASTTLIRNAAPNRYQEIFVARPARGVEAIFINGRVSVEPIACLKKRLNALVSANPLDMEAIKPLIAVTSTGPIQR
jgi:hypothetical protein